MKETSLGLFFFCILIIIVLELTILTLTTIDKSQGKEVLFGIHIFVFDFLSIILMLILIILIAIYCQFDGGDTEYNSVKNQQTKPYMAHVTFTGSFGIKGTLHGIGNTTTPFIDPLTHQKFLKITIYNMTINNATIPVRFYTEFTSPEAFAVENRINYTIKASTKPIEGIQDIYFVLDSYMNDAYQNKTDIDKLMARTNETGELVKLHMDNATFFSKINGNWTDPIEDKISVFAIVVDGQGIKRVTDNTPFLLTIAPHLNKLQADTDLSIQRQNLESIKSNANIEALTWVIIALIPIGFIIETIIHGYIVKDESSRES